MPDYTPPPPCRRQKTLAVQLPFRRADGPLNLLVESTGIKSLGDGEWHARKHGSSRRLQWRKVHLAMDTATSGIRAVDFTSSREGDSPTLPALLDQIPEDEQSGSVTADGAHDTRRCHTPFSRTRPEPSSRFARTGGFGGKTARLWSRGLLRDVREGGRAGWKRRNGYHARSRAEAKMRCLRAFGERIAARDPDRQTAEIHIRVALINRFNALGTAEVVRVA